MNGKKKMLLGEIYDANYDKELFKNYLKKNFCKKTMSK